MNQEQIKALCCPVCKEDVVLSTGIGTDTHAEKLVCAACKRTFDIIDDVPCMVYPENLLDSEEVYDRHKRYNSMVKALFYEVLLKAYLVLIGIFSGIRIDSLRKKYISGLNLRENMKFLEVGAGSGSNLKLIAEKKIRGVTIHAMDLSIEMMKVAENRIKKFKSTGHFLKGNMEYLPYRSESFDAVLHIGTISQLDVKKCIDEMYRVAKKGARLVICDEGMHPDKEKSIHGTLLKKYTPFCFEAKPPLDLLPSGAINIDAYWILQRTFWVLSFTKS